MSFEIVRNDITKMTVDAKYVIHTVGPVWDYDEETLLKLIDQPGKKDSEIYKKALLTKQHFSKIRNNPNYKPTKPTAIALYEFDQSLLGVQS